MNVIGSSYISKLLAQVTFDISGVLPQVIIDNLSEGADLTNVKFWWEILAPGDIPISIGTSTNPQEPGNFTQAIDSSNWPKAFNSILYSGAPYSFKFFCEDPDGNQYNTEPQLASICRPAGNTKNSTNPYGLATVLLEVKCSDGRVFFQDTTNATYQGITGTLGSSVLRVIYPVDTTGNIPAPFVATHFSTALVPITYSSDNYQYQSYSIYDYDFGGYVHIRIKYQSFNPKNGSPAVTFPVLCNINLCSLFCEVDKLVRDIETGNCANAQEAQQKLNLINPKLWMIVTGIQQPLCGIDVPALIEEVKVIGGFDCDCCNAPTGIIPSSSSVIDGYNFSVVTECGDTTGSFSNESNNIILTLNGVAYTFAMCDNSPAQTTAFNFTKNVEDCLATVCLNVDVTQLSFDILNNIKSNGDLVNLFNSIVIQPAPGNWKLVVDGKCIFNSATSYNYVFTLSNIPASATFAILENIQVDATTYAYAYAFNMTTLAALQAFLNGLGFGTFAVTAADATTITITSTANPTNINAIIYSPDGSTDAIADMTKSASGFTPLSANQVVQAIINYLCNLDDSQVVTSEAYTICYIDPDDGTSKTQVIAKGEELTTFITALLLRGCQTIEYITSLSPQTCDTMKTLFPASEANLQPGDYVLGTKNNDCARINISELFLNMLQTGQTNASIVEAFCAIVDLCRGDGKVCTPYASFSAYTVDYSTACPIIIKFGITVVEGSYIVTVTFANNVVSDQNVAIQYSLAADDVWISLETSQVISCNGTTIGTATVAAIGGLPTNTYNFRISDNCNSPSEWVYLYNVSIENIS